MRKLLRFLVLTSVAAAIVSVFAQDPVKVSPNHYRVEVENEFVRVLRSSGGAHARTSLHEHPANVVIYLTDADVRVVGPDGVEKDSHRKRGDAIWNEPQKHERINLSDQPYELIQVELKGTMAKGVSIPRALDPLKVTPGRYRVVVENDRVRVLHARIGPRAKAELHAHPPYVSVALLDSRQRIGDESGAMREAVRKAGSVGFNPALKHTEENLSDQPAEFILVELK
jgi:hypothetical protein